MASLKLSLRGSLRHSEIHNATQYTINYFQIGWKPKVASMILDHSQIVQSLYGTL